jgi:hypothetical protein
MHFYNNKLMTAQMIKQNERKLDYMNVEKEFNVIYLLIPRVFSTELNLFKLK